MFTITLRFFSFFVHFLPRNKRSGMTKMPIDSSMFIYLPCVCLFFLYRYKKHWIRKPGRPRRRLRGTDRITRLTIELHTTANTASFGVVESLKLTTHAKTRRIAKFAFDFAITHGRKKATAVHKANIASANESLIANASYLLMFLKIGNLATACSFNRARKYPSINFETMIVDNCCMQARVRCLC